jgi:hypothetical protein
MDHVLIVFLIIIGSIVWSIFGTIFGLFFCFFRVFRFFRSEKSFHFFCWKNLFFQAEQIWKYLWVIFSG